MTNTCNLACAAQLFIGIGALSAIPALVSAFLGYLFYLPMVRRGRAELLTGSLIISFFMLFVLAIVAKNVKMPVGLGVAYMVAVITALAFVAPSVIAIVSGAASVRVAKEAAEVASTLTAMFDKIDVQGNGFLRRSDLLTALEGKCSKQERAALKEALARFAQIGHPVSSSSKAVLMPMPVGNLSVVPSKMTITIYRIDRSDLSSYKLRRYKAW